MVKKRYNYLRRRNTSHPHPVDLKKEARDFNLINQQRANNAKSVLVDNARIEKFFFKNPWRYDFSRKYAFGNILDEFKRLTQGKTGDLHILDIGCGNGWFSINANLGDKNYWDCIDISRKAIDAANLYKKRSGISKNRYFVQSIENFESKKRYDIITCVNSLHHMSDLKIFISRVKHHLKPGGRIFVRDVSSDLFTEMNAFFVLMMRTILESTNKVRYYEKFHEEEVKARLNKIIFEWQNETDDRKQSIHDHFYSTLEIVNILKSEFDTIYFKQHGGILMRFLGGLRGGAESLARLSQQLIAIENLLLKKNVIAPYTYSFIGKSKRSR